MPPRRFGLQAFAESFWAGFLLEGDEGGGAGGAGAGGDEGGGTGGEGGAGGKAPTAYELQLRKEAADNRKRAEAAEKKLKDRETADLSETERLKREAAEAGEKATASETKSRTRIAKAETLTAAVTAKIIDPDAAFQLIQSKIEFDDEGEPKNISALLTQLVKDKPWLLGEGGAGGDGGAGGANAGKGRSLSKEAVTELAKTNPTEFNRRWEAGEFKGVGF